MMVWYGVYGGVVWYGAMSSCGPLLAPPAGAKPGERVWLGDNPEQVG